MLASTFAMQPSEQLFARAVEAKARLFFSRHALVDTASSNLAGDRKAPALSLKEMTMDKDRIKGAAKQAKGSVKEAAGKVTGDAKLRAEGKADKAARKSPQ